MKKIIGVFKPYTLEQTIYVYENGNKIDGKKIKINELDEILTMAQKYDIKQIDLTGPKQYLLGIKNNLTKDITKFSLNDEDIEINLI